MRSKLRNLCQVNTVIIGIFLFFILSKVIENPSKYLVWGDQDIVSHLVNYSSGFVRRGLFGEWIGFFMPFLKPVIFINIVSWGVFLIGIIGYIRLIRKSISEIPSIAVVGLFFLPSLFLSYIYGDTFGSKEIMGFLILFWHLYLLTLDKYTFSGYINRVLIVTMVLLPIHLFIHESSFLLFVPIHLMITYSIFRKWCTDNFLKTIFLIFLMYAPTFLSFLIIVLWGCPSFEDVVNMCQYWESEGVLSQNICDVGGEPAVFSFFSGLPGGLDALRWTLFQAMDYTRSKMSLLRLIKCLGTFFIHGASVLYIGNMVMSSFEKKVENKSEERLCFVSSSSFVFSVKYFFIPLVLSLPMYFVGVDYERWFVVVCINYMIIVLSKEIYLLEPKYHFKFLCKIPRFRLSFYIKLFIFLFVLFFMRISGHPVVKVLSAFE